MKVVVKKHGANHSYVDDEAGGERIAGVTGLVGDGLPKPNLMNWHAEATAAYAIDNWDTLAKLTPSARMQKLKGGRYESRDAAAKKGKQIHTLAERLIAGQQVKPPDEIAGHVFACVDFLNDFDLRSVHVEAVVYSETHRHAGRLDIIADVQLPDIPEYDHIPRGEDGYSRMLGDWKSGRTGIFGDVALQLAPYRFSEFMILPDGTVTDMPEVDFVAGIWLRADGGYELRPLVCEYEQYRDFLYVKEVARIQTSLRDLVGEPIVPVKGPAYRIVKGDES
ncbi:hypothetical protein [Phytohabitans rumicis]|uniref:PD-(D/E)XK endonuclease-like domain-containing protein n=1 Tax=Phytohabitans rumicis TaxID=1076125 RepID=A0A6V8L9T3_9ACTN|nr:hypothetical protein [Phytohabitans rumicis]GFJ91561.1 hypothetical protein Prum_052030 [Phytohabitans rumicis]